MSFFRVKTFEQVKEASNSKGFKRTLGALDVLMLGIGAVVGTGVFVMTGVTAAEFTGPAIILSFMLAGLASIFVALAYIEIAALIPTSGSVYTYAYVSFGEIIAWMIGWNILLEYTISAATIAAGWSGYMQGILHAAGINLPKVLSNIPLHGGIIDLPAVLIALFITSILIIGTKESARLNSILVLVKLAAIFIFLTFSAPHIEVKNWHNFAPYGMHGVLTGAATIFFAFTGFDLLSTTTEECRNPRRDIVIGLIGSLALCTIIYMAVGAVLTGVVPYYELNNAEPLSYAMRMFGSNVGSSIVATGAVAGMTTVLIVQFFAQSRLMFFMARDGMLPHSFTKLHKRYNTPYLANIITGVITAIIAGFTPIDVMGNLASTSMLTQYIVVCCIVLYLRRKAPQIVRPFKCPAVHIIAPIGIIMCAFLICQLVSKITIIFAVWAAIGLFIYFGYSRKNISLFSNH